MGIDFEGIDGGGVPNVHARQAGRFAAPETGRGRDLVRSPEGPSLAPGAGLFPNPGREARAVRRNPGRLHAAREAVPLGKENESVGRSRILETNV
jgi:hypothetical protein